MLKKARLLTRPPQRAETRFVPHKAAASEKARRTLRYVEPLNEARTKLEAFFSIPVLYEQQAGGANFFPGGRTDENLKLICGTWKCGFRFPEQGVGIRGVVLRC